MGLDQPHSPPCEIASSSAVSPAVMPSAPTRSKRPCARPGATGTSHTTNTAITAVSRPTPQNSRCQSPSWATSPPTGRPNAEPTPRTDDVSAIAAPTRRGDRTSRSRLIPSGTIPMPTPCRARPATIGASESATAQRSDPAVSSASTTSTSLRLP